MEDFNALAASLAAGVDDVRGCLILSTDGLVLGSHPHQGESSARAAWMRFAGMGDPDRGFAQFPSEIWCYVRRGPYAAFAVVGASARAGLVIDHMEQVLLAAEDTRSKREGVRGTPVPAPAAPSSKPRTALHPDGARADDPVVVPADEPGQVPARAPSPEPSEAAPAARNAEPASSEDAPEPGREAADPEPGWVITEDGDVDRFSLAREFGRLLQRDEEGADG